MEQKCADYRMGKCARGAGCKYIHDGAVVVEFDAPFKPLNEERPPSDSSRQKCADFRMGKCSRGHGCKFEHDVRTAPAPSRPPTFSAPAYASPAAAAPGAPPCGDFKSGKCKRGLSCKFSHQLGGLPGGVPLPPPISAAAPTLLGPYFDANSSRSYFWNPVTGVSEWAPPGVAAQPPLPLAAPQAVTCGDFKMGKCARGAGCKFSHGGPAVDLREMCGDFKTGKCTRGPGCKFSHGPPEMAKEECGDFKRGECSRGDACRFSHEPTRERCGDFKRGECTRGDGCRFLHEYDPEPGVEENVSAPPQECGDFKRGACSRESCKYAHIARERSRSRSR